MINMVVNGRLGNQLFQYATLRAYMWENNFEDDVCLKFIVDKSLNFSGDQLQNYNVIPYTYFKVPKLSIKQYAILFSINFNKLALFTYSRITKKDYIELITKCENKFNKMYLNNNFFLERDKIVDFTKHKNKNSYICGHFENITYFKKYRKKLKKEFTPKYKPLKENRELLKKIETSNSICISVRRGDFLKPENKNLYVCTKEYFLNAIKIMNKKVKNPLYIVFSDDVEWCKENFKDVIKDAIYPYQDFPTYETQRLMYSCKHFIISNSTFSWWAQFLSDSEDKIVIAPKKWRRNSDGHYEKALYEDDWILVGVD